MPDAALFDLRAGEVAALRGLLDDAGYTEEGIGAVVGEELMSLGRRWVPILLRRTAGGGRLRTLIRLFVAASPVPAEEAERALAPLTPARLVEARILEAVPEGLRATVQMRPYEGLLLAVDPEPLLVGHRVADDHVMGVSRSTLLLARLTDRAPGEAALDLGTGCGLQALLAARHCRRVVATDITPRAAAMARLNAALNGVDNVEVRRGDMLEPVAGEAFDLVVSNPPYIVAPHLSQHFLSAGLEGDDVCARLARALPGHLRPGGRAYFLANWTIESGQRWQERLAGWFEGSGCDVTAVPFSDSPIDEYAARWIPPDVHDPATFAAEFDAWMRWYEERGIEGVGFGLVTMRRRHDGGATLLLEPPPLRFQHIDGDDLQRALALGRWLLAVDDAAFLRARLRHADAVRVVREYSLDGQEWRCSASAVGVEGGFADPAQVDAAGERLVARCDGTRSVGELLGEMASALGRPVPEVVERILPAVRNLVERGILLPDGEAT